MDKLCAAIAAAAAAVLPMKAKTVLIRMIRAFQVCLREKLTVLPASAMIETKHARDLRALLGVMWAAEESRDAQETRTRQHLQEAAAESALFLLLRRPLCRLLPWFHVFMQTSTILA